MYYYYHYYIHAWMRSKDMLTFFIAWITGSSTLHHSHEPTFSSPFVISTSETVTFSNPFCCKIEEDEVTHPKRLHMLSMLMIPFPWKCCKIEALGGFCRALNPLKIPCIFFCIFYTCVVYVTSLQLMKTEN